MLVGVAESAVLHLPGHAVIAEVLLRSAQISATLQGLRR
jgi:hypothetical protein